MNRIDALNTLQRRKLYELCWKYEESWLQGKPWPRENWLDYADDLPPEIVIAELTETTLALQSQDGLKRDTVVLPQNERYEFIEEIARGGAAVVWRVYDRHLQRDAAVKYLLDSRDNREMRARLQREARLCAQLAHPGVVPIHELSSFDDGRPFVTMKLVEGKTLLQLLSEESPMKIELAIKTFQSVCETMAYVHSRGIVHRDLKPSNIMVGSFGEVQIMDWGIAKDLSGKHDSVTNMASPEGSGAARNASSEDTAEDLLLFEKTMIGTVFGTVSYMSPEQASGHVDLIDQRADVFALGAVLCRILTGKPPYVDSDLNCLLEKAQKAELTDAIDRLNRSPHTEWAKLALACMARDPRLRPQNAGEITRQLAAARSSKSKARRTGYLLCAAAICLAVATLVYLNTGREKELAGAPSEPAKPVESQQEPRNEEPSAQQKEEEVLDRETLMALLRANKRDVVFRYYRRTLEDNPKDADLLYAVGVALLNGERLTEAQEVVGRVVKLQPENPELYYLHAHTFLFDGKFDDAKAAIQLAYAARESGGKSNVDIEAFEAKIKRFEAHAAVAQPADQYIEGLSGSELEEFAQACESVGKTDEAIKGHQRVIDLVDDPYRRSSKRLRALFAARKHSMRNDLTDNKRSELFATAHRWFIEQIEYLESLQDSSAPQGQPSTEHIKQQLENMLKSSEMQFYCDAAKDLRIDSKVRQDIEQSLQSLDARK